jgi:NAD(P)-dependent dehydrogenase (short-subunit alcohol dehydrogenase family)
MASHLDVTDQESVERMAEQAVERFGRIDILVNNAGTIGAPGWEERERANESDWDVIYAVNVKGMARVIDVVAGYMKERRYGKIVNIASIAGRLGSLTNIAYGTSKAGAINLTQSTALELAQFNINVNAICPGLLWTPMWDRITSHLSLDREKWEGLSQREIFDRMVKERIPLGREQAPEDVGHLAAFLASDYAKNITGQAINVSGGSHMN